MQCTGMYVYTEKYCCSYGFIQLLLACLNDETRHCHMERKYDIEVIDYICCFLAWMSSLTISSSMISDYTFSNHVFLCLPKRSFYIKIHFFTSDNSCDRFNSYQFSQCFTCPSGGCYTSIQSALCCFCLPKSMEIMR